MLLAFLLACSGTPKPTDDTADTAVADADGDGIVDADDCDDSDPAIHPGAAETCDGRDEDCDGVADDDAVDATTWYADEDVDGFGDPASSSLACSRPTGSVEDDTDCNDTDAAISPDGIEFCDGIDEDCDGEIDEEAVDAVPAYVDADRDGFGDEDPVAYACESDTEVYWYGGDCDDTDPSISPAGVEVCDGVDQDCDGWIDEEEAIDAPTWYGDDDGDGFGDPDDATVSCEAPAGSIADGSDCDDSDASIAPDGVEQCDGVDQDCDGVIDEDVASTWHADVDEDGFGDATNTVLACDAPAAFVADATDCDDTDATISPDGTETCDGVDQDCDGDIDEGVLQSLSADADGDGYGDPATTSETCPAAGLVADATDCDDADATVSPDGTETCDGIDQDCDGDIDEGVQATWYADADADGFGDASSTTLACDVPAGFVADTTDCDDADVTTSPDGLEVCNDGIDQDCSGADCGIPAGTYGPSDAASRLTGVTSAGDFGTHFGVLDADGDGADDLVVVAAQDLPSQARLFFGPIVGDLSASDADATWGIDSSYATVSHAAGVGDLDGDGDDELVVTDATYPYRDGAAFLLRGDPAPVGGSLPDEAAAEWTRGYLGGMSEAVPLGDMDADGLPDLALGAPGYSRSGTYDAGTLYLLSATDAFVGGDLATYATGWIEGVAVSDEVGSYDAGLGDVDGDGVPDLAVMAPGTGTAWIVRGGDPMPTITTAEADATLTGDVERVFAGGDLDGDGLADLLLNDDGGLVLRVIPGSATLPDGVAADLAWATLAAPDATSYFARDVAHGDVTDDGDEDLLVSLAANSDIASHAGAAWYVEGPLPSGDLAATTVFQGDTADSRLGDAVGLVDLDADGLLDVVLGASGAEGDLGAVYVFPGAGW